VVGADALEWVLAGFNTAVVAIGESGSGKSHTLFGSEESVGPDCAAICPRLLEELYDAIERRHGQHDEDTDVAAPELTLAVACWEVRHDQVLDLLAAGGTEGQQASAAAAMGGPHPFVLVNAPTRRHAARLLNLARSRTVTQQRSGARLPARGSLFVRLALHDARRKSLASLYLVDVVGTSTLPTAAEAARLAETTAISAHGPSVTARSPGSLVAETRSLNKQVAALHRLMGEIGSSESPGHRRRAVGARDSKLTQQLAPLFMGACRTQIVACVQGDMNHFSDTCATLRAASQALRLQAPCMRLPCIERSELNIAKPEAVLPPPVPLKRTSAHPASAPVVPWRTLPKPESEGSDDWEAEYDDDVPAQVPVAMATKPHGQPSTCARLRGAGPTDDDGDALATPTGALGSGKLRAELHGLMAQLGSQGEAGVGAPPVEEWVSKELERRVQAELEIARGARGARAASSNSASRSTVTLSDKEPVIHSYAAKHAERRKSASPSASPRKKRDAHDGSASSAATQDLQAALLAPRMSEEPISQETEVRPSHASGNYETVLSLLKESDDSRKEERQRTEDAEREALESATVHELAFAELRKMNLELRKKLRRLEGSSSHASAFQLYEADIESLSSQLEASRVETAELEGACREASMAYEVARDAARHATGEEWPGGISATMEAKLGRVKTYRRALTSTEKEVKELRSALTENAKALRQSEVHRRSADDATRRLHKLSRDHEKTLSELTAVRLLASQAEAVHSELRERVRQAEHDADVARREAAAQTGQVDGLKEQISKLQFERRKDAVVLRMAPRLQSSAEKLRQHLLGRSRARGTPRASRGATSASAPEILHTLERELAVSGKSPKAMILLSRAKQAVDGLEQARQEGAEREDELLQLLVENLAPEPEASSPARSAASRRGSP
jgi:polyhydroxyalkanoate synthesis regulator phasin